MDGSSLVRRLIADAPLLHWVSPEDAQEYAEFGLAEGATSWAVPLEILLYLIDTIKPNWWCLETGGGYTTVALGALAAKHVCINPDAVGNEIVRRYLAGIGGDPEKVTWIQEPSDVGFSRIDPSWQFDFAFIDGCHGFPFPAIDWHFVDLRLRTGGIIGVDDTHIASVAMLCQFLESNQTYSLVHSSGNTRFYRKLTSEKREWVFQQFNKRPSPQEPKESVIRTLLLNLRNRLCAR